MKHITNNGLWKTLLMLLLSFGSATTVMGQSKLHVDVDYHYNLGLSENFMGYTLSRNNYNMGGHSIHLTSRYDISTLWSAGIGIGLDRYTEPEYNTMPIFATVRYKIIRKIPDLYTYTNIGYALKGGNYTKGFTGDIGIGYTHMLAKHFGLNIQIGYNLKRFTNIPVYSYDDKSGEETLNEESSTRHSLSFGIGLTF